MATCFGQFYVRGSVHRESVSITVQRDATICSFIIFLQAALHVSDDTLIHHQEHTPNCNYNIWHWSNCVCYHPLTWRSWNFDSSTSVDGSKHGLTSARCCNYSFECAPDDRWGYHLKHVELSAENIIKLYIVASRWTVIDVYWSLHHPQVKNWE